MKKSITLGIGLLCLALSTGAEELALIPARQAYQKPAQSLLIKYKKAPATMQGPLSKLKIARQSKSIGLTLQAQSATLKQSPNVDWVEPNAWRYALAHEINPNDIYYRPERNSRNYQQWYLFMINANFAWSVSKGKSELVVAVIDSGIDLNHPDLKDRLLPGISIVNQEDYTPPANGMDDNGHGTHVAGLIAAQANNETGISGCSWEGKLLPIKVLSDKGEGTDADISEGIIWATDHGADIINLSLGGSSETGTPPQALQDAVTYAHNQGVLVIAASGNSGDDSIFYPASLDHVLSVAATNPWDERATYSTYNPHVDLSAPGGAGGNRFDRSTGMISTYWSRNSDILDEMSGPEAGDYAVTAGTSMAAAIVSGAAVVLWGNEPSQTASDIEMRLKASAIDIGSAGADQQTGSGRIDLLAALGEPTPNLPDLTLYNYPNPFNPDKNGQTQIVFLLDEPINSHIKIYDVARDLVWQKEIPSHDTLTGKNVVTWDGKNRFGNLVANGTYLVHVTTSNGQKSKIKFIAVIR